jgi:hypothetical protein
MLRSQVSLLSLWRIFSVVEYATWCWQYDQSPSMVRISNPVHLSRDHLLRPSRDGAQRTRFTLNVAELFLG